MKRDKDSTKQKLIDAVGRIILKEGFSGIGINSIAKEAGVDKVLIYRYFNGLDGLLKNYVTQKDYYSNKLFNSLSNVDNPAILAKRIFSGQLNKAVTDKEFQEIILWELNTKNEITTSLADDREKAGLSLLKYIEKKFSFKNTDIAAITAVIIGGIYYLALRSRTAGVFNGIDLTKKRGWKRIDKALQFLISVLINTEEEK